MVTTEATIDVQGRGYVNQDCHELSLFKKQNQKKHVGYVSADLNSISYKSSNRAVVGEYRTERALAQRGLYRKDLWPIYPVRSRANFVNKTFVTRLKKTCRCEQKLVGKRDSDREVTI